MADKDKNETVDLEEEGVVTVDVSDKPELATVEGVDADETTEKPVAIEAAAEPKPKEKKTKTPRVKPTPESEATQALKQAVQTAEDARRAAEQTAQAAIQRADAATRVAQSKEQEALSYKDQADARQLDIITTGIESSEREVTAYQQELQRAYEAGEFKTASETQVKLSKATARLDRLQDAKENLETTIAKKTTEGKVEVQPQIQTQTDPFEQYISGFAPRAQSWLRAHRDCAPAQVGGNPTKNASMMAGHWDALAKNIQEGSDEYFRVIEEHAGYRTPVEAEAEEEEVVETKPAAKQKLTAQPSAPVSREVPSATNGQVPRTTRSVTLTKEQQEAAKMSFPHLEPAKAFAIYARNLLELEAEGKMGRLTH